MTDTTTAHEPVTEVERLLTYARALRVPRELCTRMIKFGNDVMTASQIVEEVKKNTALEEERERREADDRAYRKELLNILGCYRFSTSRNDIDGVTTVHVVIPVRRGDDIPPSDRTYCELAVKANRVNLPAGLLCSACCTALVAALFKEKK